MGWSSQLPRVVGAHFQLPAFSLLVQCVDAAPNPKQLFLAVFASFRFQGAMKLWRPTDILSQMKREGPICLHQPVVTLVHIRTSRNLRINACRTFVVMCTCHAQAIDRCGTCRKNIANLLREAIEHHFSHAASQPYHMKCFNGGNCSDLLQGTFC